MSPEDQVKTLFRIIGVHLCAYFCYFAACIRNVSLRSLEGGERWWFHKASYLVVAFAAVALVLFWAQTFYSSMSSRKADFRWYWFMLAAAVGSLVRFYLLTLLDGH
jgi:hypothetical protein